MSAARSKREEEYREEEERLAKEIEKAITYLSIREFANKYLKDTLSKPTELIGEFKEVDEFERLVKEIYKENALTAKKRDRALIKEAYY